MPAKTQPQQNVSALAYAVCALIGLLVGIGLLFFYVYQVPKMVESGVQNQVFYLLLLPWALSCAAFLFGAMRSYARFTHKRLGNALELGGPVVLFCLVVAGGFKLVPAAADSFDLTVRAHSQRAAVITTGNVVLELDNTRRSEPIGSNGEANFKGIPAKFRGATVRILPQILGYKEEWMQEKLSGSALDLPLAAMERLQGTIIPVPRNWNKLTVHIEGQEDEARVDQRGRFSIPVTAIRGDKVRLLIYEGNKQVKDTMESPYAPVTITLEH
jgi:hypothetical protein